MKRFSKTIMFALILSAIPARIWAQDYMTNPDVNATQEVRIRDFENGFLFNVFEIENVEERIQLASALATSDIWICNPTHNPGELFIRPNSYNADIPIYAEFDYLRMTLREEYEAVSSLPKEEFGEIFNSWARNISDEYYNFLISDHLDRANHCLDAEPFCTSDVYTFPSNNSGYSWSGPDYGCLGSSPTNKHSFWYYMRIGVAGNITIKMEAPFDIDFALWGPFSNETDPCPTAAQTGMLTSNCTSCPNNTSNPNFYPSGNLHDCSFSAQAYEYAHVVNGQVGQYFILLITNYNGGSGNITFQKYAGDGETDCGILPPLVDNDGPYCVGETINLTANGQAGASYSWSGPGGFSSSLQNPTRPNCTMNMAGTYTCTISLGGATNSATTEVVIYPQPTANFNFTTVCLGNPTQFSSTSTTNPSGQQITSYLWDFGDGQTSTLQSPSHTYANAGTYPVTLTVSCGNGLCTSTKTQSVTVYAQPAANAGPDQTIPYGTTAQLSGSGGAGTFNFHWEPANMVVNPNAQNTQTVVLTQDQTYTLTVTNPQGQCTSTDEVTIHISGSAMTVAAGPNISICQGGSGQIYVNAGGGTGNITYSWTPTTGLSNPNIYTPIASPSQTTTYTCTVSDGQTSQSASVTVTVNDVIIEHEYMTICPGDVYTWHGAPYTGIDTYQFDTVTDQGCDKTIYLHLDHYPTYDETLIEEAICFGESYNFYGTNYSTNTQTLYHDQTIHGCDSIVRLELTVYPANDTTIIDPSICVGQTYNFHGTEYNQDGQTTYFDTIDSHGCLKVEKLVLSVGEYQMPAIQNEYICYGHDETPYFKWDKNNVEYHADTYDEAIVPDPDGGCDFKYRLNLKFHQEFYSEEEPVVTCDEYRWPLTGERFTETDHHVVRNFHGGGGANFNCDSTYILDITINTQSILDDVYYRDSCDHVYIPWHCGQDSLFTSNTVYTFRGQTEEGCYLEQTFHIENMHYTPNPNTIKCSDGSAVVFALPEDPDAPVQDTAMCAAVVTNTEFFSFQYTFYVEETNRSCVWESCNWSISKPSWAIEFNPVPIVSLNGKYYSECTVYVADRQDDYVVLTATINNGCGSEERRFYLKSSFLDVDDNPDFPAKVNIVPNPNNGQMHLDFENMEGRTSIKVFDMTGNQIDAFETNINSNRYNYDYNMKRYAEGIYFFVVSNNNRVFTKKVVIIR